MQDATPAPAEASPLSGFTLLELLVVLAILALLAALVPRLTRHSPGLSVRAAATALAADLRVLRTEATQTRQSTSLVLRDHAYVLNAIGFARSVTTEMSLTYAAPEPDFLGRQTDRLKFFSDGSSSGGTVTLRDGNSQAFIAVNWLDGAVTVHAQ